MNGTVNMSTTPQATRPSVASAKPISLVSPSLRERVKEATRQIESEIILETLEQNRWNRRRTAKALADQLPPADVQDEKRQSA